MAAVRPLAQADAVGIGSSAFFGAGFHPALGIHVAHDGGNLQVVEPLLAEEFSDLCLGLVQSFNLLLASSTAE